MLAEYQSWTHTLRYLAGLNQIDISSAWRILELMQEHGQSVTLNWGEDTGQWECSWITGGERFSGFSSYAATALLFAARRAVEATDAGRPRKLQDGPTE